MDEMTNWITRENIVERYRLERITKSERGREERERERERESEREREREREKEREREREREREEREREREREGERETAVTERQPRLAILPKEPKEATFLKWWMRKLKSRSKACVIATTQIVL